MTSGAFTGPFGDPDEKYIGPFGDPNTDHDSPDCACLARSAYTDPTLATIQEYVDMAHIAIENKYPQVALFLVRHVVELLLKACIRTDRHEGELEALQKALKWHDLKRLLLALKRQNDDLWSGTDWAQPKIRDFIRDLNRVDPNSTDSRYPVNFEGGPTLLRTCCVDLDRLDAYLLHLSTYMANRDAELVFPRFPSR